ncbi:cysteine dioxygenase type 1-like [Xenia sp. Carnegie-2017]|uniref:cysteine dioxygenase type 1-like n=1 Tax=Xenia sp. Carnegie-2017 TaxID=2897299 RepID=UPI001F04AEE5|nr:cysteine dioxygenase type 1-like [Xenia sp. Carnegie-2017]
MKLDELIEELHILFDKEKVNIDAVKQTMESYKSNFDDWEKYAHFSPHRYTRNLVDRGNGKFNLILLCWSEGQASGIHDHSNSHCFMKIMEGQLKETLYSWPQNNDVEESLNVQECNYFKKDEVAYICDQIGLHRVENESHSNVAASLHLYSPPFDFACSFDERTGKAFQCPVTFYSEGGEIVKRK